MHQWVMNNIGLSAGAVTVLVGLVSQQVLSYLKRTIADELSEIDKITDPDWRAWAISTLALVDKKFPTTGAVGAVDALVTKFPKLKPLSGSLIMALANLQIVVKQDLDNQVKQDQK